MTQVAQIVKFQDNEVIMGMFETNAITIQKKALTSGRLPTEDEVGQELITYVADSEGNVKEETRNVITADVVIARNPTPVADGVYNEWLIDKETWLKNYGVEATTEMKEYQKLGTIQALPITEEVLKELGSIDGETAMIEVSWSDSGMEIYKGGMLCDQGYGLAPSEYKNTYQVVE